MPPSNESNIQQPTDVPGRTTFSRLGKNPRMGIVDRIKEAIALDQTTINEENLSEHTIRHDKRDFVLEDWVARKRKRKSWIAEHGTWITELLPGNKGEMGVQPQVLLRISTTILILSIVSKLPTARIFPHNPCHRRPNRGNSL
jgi:hypothetical protein